MDSNININLSAVVYCENGVWIAHCLELDIVAHGVDQKEATESLVSLCDLQISTAIGEGDLASIFRPAPSEAWALFSGAHKRKPRQKPPQFSFKAPVDRFESREAVSC